MTNEAVLEADFIVEDGLPRNVMNDIMRFILPFRGKRVTLKLALWKKKRTLNQNSFFHGPFLDDVCEAYEEAGNDHSREEIKEQLKERWGLRKTITAPDGTKTIVLVSTKEYTTIQIEDFMMKIRAAFAPFKRLCYPNEGRYEAAN